jgi:hypothetical protein
MRTKPIVGRKAWFGPRTLGWGWGPIAWEGWVASVAFIAIVFAYPVVFGDAHRDLVALGATGALLVLCLVKGTAPGGPRRAAELKRLSP